MSILYWVAAICLGIIVLGAVLKSLGKIAAGLFNTLLSVVMFFLGAYIIFNYIWPLMASIF